MIKLFTGLVLALASQNLWASTLHCTDFANTNHISYMEDETDGGPARLETIKLTLDGHVLIERDATGTKIQKAHILFEDEKELLKTETVATAEKYKLVAFLAKAVIKDDLADDVPRFEGLVRCERRTYAGPPRPVPRPGDRPL